MIPYPNDEAWLTRLVIFDAKNRVLWRLLDRHLREARDRLKDRAEVSLLDVGCGVCEEARVLTAFFGGNRYDVPSSRVRLVGVDCDAALITQAQTLCGIPSPTEPAAPFAVAPRCEFFAADATRLNQLKGIPTFFDIVLLRHQFLASDLLQKNAVWATILSQSLAALAADGTLILTSYREVENELLLKVLAVYPCEIIANIKNRWAISQEMPNMPESYFDKFLTVVRHGPSHSAKK